MLDLWLNDLDFYSSIANTYNQEEAVLCKCYGRGKSLKDILLPRLPKTTLLREKMVRSFTSNRLKHSLECFLMPLTLLLLKYCVCSQTIPYMSSLPLLTSSPSKMYTSLIRGGNFLFFSLISYLSFSILTSKFDWTSNKNALLSQQSVHKVQL